MKPSREASNIEVFDRLFYGYQKGLFAYVVGQTGNPHSAEDILQQVFVKVWRHVADVRQKSDEATRNWLFAVTRNAIIDHHRKQATNPLSMDVETEDSGPDQYAQLEQQETLDRLSLVIAKLPPDIRTAFCMSLLGEMTSEEIGSALGKPAGTVRYLVSEARRIIKQEVER